MQHSLFGRAKARVFSTATVAAAVLATALGASDGALAKPRAAIPHASASLARTGSANPILGWMQFCSDHPSECTVDVSEPSKITLTPQVWQTLVSVNRQVNASIKPETDMDHWGVEDHWDFAEDGYGDCEDYQLVKRRRLVAAGLPRRALRMTVVLDEDGAGHAVMMVRTDRGDFILDNKRNTVLPWSRTGYTYIKREGDDGVAWASLGGKMASPIATAGR